MQRKDTLDAMCSNKIIVMLICCYNFKIFTLNMYNPFITYHSHNNSFYDMQTLPPMFYGTLFI